MRKVFAFSNQKGGVGKTTTCINVAAAVSEMGYKVVVVDLDPQGNATSGLGIDKESCELTTYDVVVNKAETKSAILDTDFPNLFVLPATSTLSAAEVELVNEFGREFVLQKKIAEIKEDFDYVFIDCPPSLGLLTINGLVSADALIVPLQCEYYALEGLSQLLNVYTLVSERLNSHLIIGGVVLTLADFRANLTTQVIEEVKNFFGEKVFQEIIPRAVRVSEAPSFGKPAIFYDRYNKGSLAYLSMAKEFVSRFGVAKPEEVVQ